MRSVAARARLLADAGALPVAAGEDAERIVAHGDPAKALLDLAQRREADVVAAGSRAPGVFRRRSSMQRARP